MIGKRTGIDFSKHEVNITDGFDALVHYLKKPNTIHDSIKYINTNGIMAVTGDYGNWIFCREYRPSAEGRVSDSYWLEKLRNSSTQEGEEYSPEMTRLRVLEMINGGAREYGYEGQRLDEIMQYYERCMDLIDEEFEYKHYAYTEHPGFMDPEEVIYSTDTKYWLKAVFDGFDEICRRIKEGEVKP